MYLGDDASGGQDVGGTTAVPCLRWLIDQRFGLDVNAVEGLLDATWSRIEPTGTPGSPRILALSYDATRKFAGATQPDDKDEWEWTLGLRFFAKRNITLSAEYLRTEGRDQFDNEVWNLLARFEF